MSIVQIDPLGWIPEETKERVLDSVVEFVARQAEKALGDKAGRSIRKLKSDAVFQAGFAQGIRRATERFIREYTPQDEDLVAAIIASPDFWQAQSVRQALLALVGRPGSPPDPEQWQSLAQHFDDVLPQRVNRERVDRAVALFLRCLAEEVWHLPEIRPIYELQVQRITAERAGAMVQELQALRGEIREVLLALVQAQSNQQQLAAPAVPALLDPPRVYHNLPQPDYVRFVGREAELTDIRSLLSPDNRAWVIVIDGIGGIGKSALALEVAHRYLREYLQLPEPERFRAIVWASAKSAVLTADGIAPRQQITRTLDDIYATVAAALEREDITRGRAEGQDNLVCRALTQQRTLLILDNLETIDDERVNAFLRELPAPTKCIVTTRHRIDVAYPIRLQEMPRADGLALVAQECAKKEVVLERLEAEKLYDRTGGVPLAIVWSVAQMGYGHGVEAVLRRLGDAREDISRYCFEGAMERIRERPAHTLLLALALFAAGASREALGYVTDLPMADRDEGLVDLDKLSLANRDSGRFRMLPLTKQYALAGIPDDPRRSTLEERWIGYYGESSAAYADEHWNWTNYDWLLAEGENILALVMWAVAAGRGEVALAVTRPVMRYLDIRGRWSELFKYGELLYNVAQTLNDQRTAAWICAHWLAWLYGEQAEVEQAQRWALEGIALYEALSEPRGLCLSKLYLSRALRRGGQFAASEREANSSMELARDVGYGDGMAMAHDQLGKIARDQGLWERAREHFSATLSWCEEHEEEANLDVTIRMNVLGNLGWLEYQLGNYERGKELCERSLRSFEWIGGRGYTTTLQCYLAKIEWALGNEAKAVQYARDALYWAERLQLVRELKMAQDILGQIEE